MALILPGNTTANSFEQGTGVATSGKTKHAIMCKFKCSGTAAFYSLLSTGGSFVGEFFVTSGNIIQAKMRTNSLNTLTGIGTLVANTEYVLFATMDLVAGEIKYFINGSQAGTTISASGHTMLSTTAKAKLTGATVDGKDVTVTECAIWWDSIPTPTDIANYQTGTALASLSAPPTARYLPTGNGTSYVSSISDLSGSNNMTHIAGPTSVDNFPYADAGGGGGSTTLAWGTINGTAVTSSSVYFLARNKTTGLAQSVTIAGTYTGSNPAVIYVKSGNGSFKTLATAPTGGTYSGTVNLEVGDLLQLRADNDNASIISMSDFAVGDDVLVIGQSNPGGTIVSPPGSYPATIFRVRDNGSLTKGAAPSSDYHMGYAVALYKRRLGVPVRMLNVAIGATSIDTWQSGQASWNTAASNLATAASSNALTSGNEMVTIWWQGESDTSKTATQYRDALNTMLTSMRASWGIGKAFVIPIISNGSAGKQGIQDGTIAACALDPTNIYFGAWIDDIPNDGSHVTDPNEAEIIGSRLAESLIMRYDNRGVNKYPVALLTATYAAVTDVRSGVNRGDGQLGTMEVPTASQTLLGVAVDATTGTVVLPSAAGVLDTVSFGPGGATAGTYHAPSAGEVISTAVFGPSSGTSGTFVSPATTDVLSGVQYGAGGTEFVGTLTGGGSDWTANEKAAIRAILGIPDTGSTPVNPTVGVLSEIHTNVDAIPLDLDTKLGEILEDTDSTPKYGDSQRWDNGTNTIDVTITQNQV